MGLLVVSFVILSCKKPVLDVIGNQFAAELWEDRPKAVGCEPETSSQTLVNEELTFDSDHMFCVNISMDYSDFDNMRHESRFGPSIKEDNGAVVTGVLLEYLGQCDVPFPSEYNWYHGRVTIDGLQINDVGIRKKGFLGSVFSIAPAFKVQTSLFGNNGSFGKTQNITFNNNSEDPTRVVQCLKYRIFEMAGYPAPRCNLANVTINKEALGVYTHIEGVDESFLLTHFGNNNGDLYEGQLVDFVSDWLPRWDAKTPQTDPMGRPILNICSVLENASDETLVQELSEYVDLDRFMTFWALEILLEHEDGYAVNRNNFFVYFNPDDNNRAVFIPWGLNYFSVKESKDSSLRSFIGAEIPRRLSRIPAMKKMLENELDRLLKDVWDEIAFIAMIDQFAQQVETAQVDEDYGSSINDLKTWTLNRRTEIELILGSGGIPIGGRDQAKKCFKNDG